jgi:hypothetical protein
MTGLSCTELTAHENTNNGQGVLGKGGECGASVANEAGPLSGDTLPPLIK